MTFKKAVLWMLAIYLAAITAFFGPTVMKIFTAESRLGRLPVKMKLSPDQRIAYVRKQVLGTVKVDIHPYDAERGMGEGFGTGSVFTKDGYILTAAHVVEDMEFVYVTFHQLDGSGIGYDELREEPADILAISHDHDMAIIKLRHPERLNLTLLPLEPTNMMPKNSTFWFIGCRSGVRPGIVMKVDATEKLQGSSGESPTVLRGTVVARTFADHGDSGGPVLNDDGNVIGIIIGSDQHGIGVISPLRHGFAELLAQAQEKAKHLK